MKHATRSFLAVAVIASSLTVATALARADAAGGKKNYDDMCASCHGASGGGDGPAGSGLEVKPTNFTDCAKMSKVTDDTLFKAIKDGGSAVGLNAAMPPQGGALSDADIKDVVAYIRAFCKK